MLSFLRRRYGAGLAFALAGCSGMQSALDPAGRDAARIASITFWMSAVFLVIWLGMIALALYAPRASQTPRSTKLLIGGGGVALPVIVLSILLFGGLPVLPEILEPGAPRLEVTGAQWWWRVRYVVPGQPPIELANEIRLPAGERIDVRLRSRDVIHSFWIPSLAGKMDMIPGRVNRIALEPLRTGTFRGTCAEFCGDAHAMMSFPVIVMEKRAFASWLAAEATSAREPASASARRGREAFFTHGCNTCHTIRGTDARGVFGPDLTHVASRRTIAAGILPSDEEHLRRWIAGTETIKPGTHMPAFAQLPPGTLHALGDYLAELR